MVDKRLLLTKLKPYIGSLKIVKYSQGTGDIIKELLQAHKDEAKEYDKIYPYFIGRNVRETCRNIYNFLKQNVRYDIEPSSKQTLKSPSSIIAQGYGDCKQYSQFIGGILGAMERNRGGAEWCYRFASYNDQKIIQHVFVVAKDKEGKEIWIDPVLPKFDQRKKYNYKIDKKPSMALYRISGTNDIGKISLKKLSLKNVTKAVKKVAKPVAKVVKVVAKGAAAATPAGAAALLAKGGIKKAGKAIIKKVAKKGAVKVAAKAAVKKAAKGALAKATAGTLTKVVVKVGTAPSRNAFLALVAANKAGLATKLGAALSSLQGGLKPQWESLGGKYNTLASTILKGSKVAISGTDNRYYSDSIGVVDISKVYTTALPVLKKLQPILLSVGIDVDSLLEKGTNEAIQTVADNVVVTDQNEIADINKEADVTTIPSIEPSADQSPVQEVDTTVDTTGKTATVNIQSGASGYQKFIIPAAAAAALYFLLKKR
jgi:hypothetical protein